MLSKITLGIHSFLVICLLLTTHNASAWGQNGHRIIGQIAEVHLTPTTQSALLPLLEGESLAQISTWADEMRSDPSAFWQKKSSRWHYINAPDSTTGFIHNHNHSLNKDTVTNILEGIHFSINTLKDKKSSIDAKRFSLRFLVHLVGDSHQPFHAGRKEDRGGNNISVTFFGQDTNLHSLWDTKLIENENLSYTEFAHFINSNDKLLIADYLQSTPAMWLEESNNIANVIYNKNETKISYQYIYTNMPIIKTRLQQSGIRLSGLLNLIFDNSAKPLVDALKMPANTN
ncbi:S1/P1 Nuclease [Pseudoalteromonas porphyrae]|uniref:S1/P1 Nuclease n=1 Tax=Pseudoalteromonas porphyrae TaxID=187330 RepID=A0A0N1EPB2_9GAMM|nr:MULTISPECIES: S1/P1 nuclease [Pseudoalteromonas]KPH58023.1 S1/P1 Nuclease [Pseudoalteromonas porphyrae]KPH93796.1 S1/P1 Nuclease [Pseudoalteromonas porphyrae]NNG43163.1 S1/P1 nuclease [Pseudoalteromonas sp. NEC-BIFX-2020_002]